MQAARAEGLRYVTDREPGIRRVRRGKSFVYVRPDGKRLVDRIQLDRIRKLAIPPAYEDVWICTLPEGHLQATGRDARGRKQYRYHARWRVQRDGAKFDRMLEFGRALPRIRRRVALDLRKTGLPRERVLATLVRLLERTLIRVGNEEYARTNKSFGLTTLRNRHAEFEGETLQLVFRGKSGVAQRVCITDKRLARLVRDCQEIPGQELFQWVDADGARHRITSSDVNDYLREASGGSFTAKDFRTWFATLEALELLRGRRAETVKEAKQHVLETVTAVATRLGNTPSICRKCYIHPDVLLAYAEGRFAQLSSSDSTLALRALLTRKSSRKLVNAVVRRRNGAGRGSLVHRRRTRPTSTSERVLVKPAGR